MMESHIVVRLATQLYSVRFGFRLKVNSLCCCLLHAKLASAPLIRRRVVALYALGHHQTPHVSPLPTDMEWHMFWTPATLLEMPSMTPDPILLSIDWFKLFFPLMICQQGGILLRGTPLRFGLCGFDCRIWAGWRGRTFFNHLKTISKRFAKYND